MGEDTDFRRVTFEKEREKILSDLESKSIVLAGLTDDQHQFLFNVRKVRGGVLYVEPVAPVGRSLKRGESLQVLFGLPDGLYLLKTRIESAEEPILINIGQELFRLQRRNNFRTAIPSEMKVIYRLSKLMSDVVAPVGLAVVDLSAGGVRVKWPVQDITVPRVGDQVAGVLHLPSGKQLEIFGTVKNLFSGTEGHQLQVGIEFQNLSIRDEQALLFVCMQIHREQAPLVK